MIDLLLLSLFEGSFTEILVRVLIIIGGYFLFAIILQVPVGLYGFAPDCKSIVGDFNKWIQYFSIRGKYEIVDIFSCAIMLIPMMVGFYLSEWVMNFVAFFMNFDEYGALNFILRWMPDNLFFNILRNIFFCWDFLVNLFFICLLLQIICMFVTLFCRGFIVKTVYRALIIIIIGILYIDNYGEWFCYEFAPNYDITFLIDKCYFGFMFKNNIEYTYPIAGLLTFCFYEENNPRGPRCAKD